MASSWGGSWGSSWGDSWGTVVAGGITVSADAGSYTLTGTDAGVTLSSTKRVSADPGSYVLTGTDASLRVTWRISAEPGSYVLTGTNASLTVALPPEPVVPPTTAAGGGGAGGFGRSYAQYARIRLKKRRDELEELEERLRAQAEATALNVLAPPRLLPQPLIDATYDRLASLGLAPTVTADAALRAAIELEQQQEEDDAEALLLLLDD